MFSLSAKYSFYVDAAKETGADVLSYKAWRQLGFPIGGPPYGESSQDFSE